MRNHRRSIAEYIAYLILYALSFKEDFTSSFFEVFCRNYLLDRQVFVDRPVLVVENTFYHLLTFEL